MWMEWINSNWFITVELGFKNVLFFQGSRTNELEYKFRNIILANASLEIDDSIGPKNRFKELSQHYLDRVIYKPSLA